MLVGVFALIIGVMVILSRQKPAPEVNNISVTPGTVVNARGDLLLYNNESYQILKLKKTSEYIISVYDSPFEKYRQQAEWKLLTLLEISPKDACFLKVKISTPEFVNPEESQKMYPLSFCQS